ncbi:MAG: hypothetical protein HY764_00280 [Candidatus Portnoybacteria bacterium]|nr:hypothetical protein [Candidatus Portnoybacteria bacterium]
MGLIAKLKEVVGVLLGEQEAETSKTTTQRLQEAVRLDIELANARGEAATAAVISVTVQRKELQKLVTQHQELNRLALVAEKAGNSGEAQRILALKLAIGEKIDSATEQYEVADKNAQTLVAEARKQFAAAEEASKDLPRRVLQLELNSMVEKARKLEGDALAQIEGKQTYKSLADSIDLSTAKLMAQNLIKDSTSLGLDEEVGQVMKKAAFQEAYKKLKERAAIEGGVIDAEIIAPEDPATKALKLLSSPPIGGLLSDQKVFVAAPKTEKKE